MKRILVSLVSDQTIPNIEFIKEMEAVDAYLFVSTEGMEKQGRREWIIKTAKIPPSKKVDTVVVDLFSFEDIEEKLSKFVVDDADTSYIVNLTGGTKIMSQAVYDFFKIMQSEMYYLTGTGKKIRIHPGRRKTVSDIKAKISVEDYLNAYGFTVKSSKPIRDLEYASKLLNYFLKEFSPDQDKEVLDIFRKARSRGLRDLNDQPGVLDFLNRVSFVMDQPDRLSKYECKYLSGEWLEEYLYLFIREELKIEDANISMGVSVKKANVDNELDVVLMLKNKIYLFECKTSVYSQQEEGQTFISETIYKSDSLRNKFGLFGQTVIVTLSNLEGPKLAKHKDRADASGVRLIGRKSFVENSLIGDLNKLLNPFGGR